MGTMIRVEFLVDYFPVFVGNIKGHKAFSGIHIMRNKLGFCSLVILKAKKDTNLGGKDEHSFKF